MTLTKPATRVHFPPPPWRLVGSATFIPRLIDSKVARKQMPSGLKLVSVLPGKTLGGVLVAHYGDGSTLAYNEFIVVGGLVRRGWCVGAWISNIYVDLPESMAGGHQIWGLPKELAEFEYLQGSTVVRHDSRPLLWLECSRPRSLIPFPLWGPAWGIQSGRLVHFTAKGRGRLQTGKAMCQTPSGSSFSDLIPSGVSRFFRIDRLDVTVDAPRGVR